MNHTIFDEAFPFNRLPYSKTQKWLLVVIPTLAILVPAYFETTSGRWLASPDSMAYMEMAQSCAEGNGLCIRMSYGLSTELRVKTGHWPPGYPLLMVPFIRLGMSPYQAGLAVDILSALGALLLIFHFYSKLLPFGLTVCAGLGTAVWMRGSVADVLSEAPFIFFTCLSIFLLERGCKATSYWLYILLAGLVCGWSATIRFVGIALIIAEVIWLLTHFRWRRKLSSLVQWSLGLLIGYGWLVLYNLKTFGRVFPHNDDPRGGNPLFNFIVGTLNFIEGGFVIKKQTLILSLLALWTVLFVLTLIIGFIYRKGDNQRTKSFFKVLGGFFRQNDFLLFWVLYAAGISGISILSYVRWAGHGAMGRFWIPIDWIKSFFVVSLIYLLFCQFYVRKTSFRLTVLFFSAAMILLIISATIRLEMKIAAGHEVKIGKTVYPLEEDWFSIQRKAAERLHTLVSENQLVALGPDYPHIYWRSWGNMNSRRMVNQGLAEIQKLERSGILWGFVVMDPDDFISGFDEETQNKLIIPLLRHPEKFPQYEVIELADYITAFRYIGPIDGL